MELQGTDEQVSAWFGGFSALWAGTGRTLDYRISEKDDVESVVDEKGFRVRF